jgi:hypothetical protein
MTGRSVYMATQNATAIAWIAPAFAATTTVALIAAFDGPMGALWGYRRIRQFTYGSQRGSNVWRHGRLYPVGAWRWQSHSRRSPCPENFSPVVRLTQGWDAVPRAGNETISGGGQGFARVRMRALSVV